jgi:hypothetical protein
MNDCTGTVFRVACDREHRFSKPLRDSITLIEGHGVEGDAHAGPTVRHRFLARRQSWLPNLRQIHLMAAELLAELGRQGHAVGPGELGENITTRGIRLEHLPLGTKLHLGETAVVELTGLRTPCGLIDRFQRGLRKKMFASNAGGPKYNCGVLGIVVAAGRVWPGDTARVVEPKGPRPALPAL